MSRQFVVGFAPAIKSMVTATGALFNSFSKLSEPTRKFLGIGLIFAALLPPLIVGMGTLAISFAVVSAPIWATAAAIGAVAFAITQVIANWDTLSAKKDFWKDFWGWADEKDPMAGIKTAEEGPFGAAVEKSKQRIAEKKKIGVEGSMRVSLDKGLKSDKTNIPLNVGTQGAGA
jgi:hypothetical protein